MRLRRIRWFLVLCAAMLVANNAMAAVRACSLGLTGSEHLAIHPREAQADRHVCPDSGDENQCLAHCTQSAKTTEPNLSSDVPTPVVPSMPTGLVVSVRPATAASVVLYAPRLVGPRLTILFRKLRN